MNVSGHRISTTEVESALVDHEAVAEAAVVGATDPTTGQAIVGYVIVRSGHRAVRRAARADPPARRHQARCHRPATRGHHRAGPAQDPVRQDHAPPAPRRRRGPHARRHHHAGRRVRRAGHPRPSGHGHVLGRLSPMGWLVLLGIVVALLAARRRVRPGAATKHSILRNYPVGGHLRFILEAFGPELRQYIVTSNDEERPFSRDERRWIYTSAKNRRQHLRLRHRQHRSTPRRTTSSSSTAAFPGAPSVRRAVGARPRSSRCRAPRCSAPRTVGASPGDPSRS